MEHRTEYSLFAIPSLFAKGTSVGELRGITFIALSGCAATRCFVMDMGQFEKAFTQLMGLDKAREQLYLLRAGISTALPGQYQPEQLEGGFQYLPAHSITQPAH